MSLHHFPKNAGSVNVGTSGTCFHGLYLHLLVSQKHDTHSILSILHISAILNPFCHPPKLHMCHVLAAASHGNPSHVPLRGSNPPSWGGSRWQPFVHVPESNNGCWSIPNIYQFGCCLNPKALRGWCFSAAPLIIHSATPKGRSRYKLTLR